MLLHKKVLSLNSESDNYRTTMNKILLKAIISLFFLITPLAYSNVLNPINFSQISLNDGLSQSTVFSIAQDQMGNMWFATYDGLNKYDGYSFTVYRHDYSDPKSIASDINRTLKFDSKGVLWIGTREGLSCYDVKKDNFINFRYKGVPIQVNAIAEIKDDILILGTTRGVLFFDTNRKEFVPSPNRELSNLSVNYLLKDYERVYLGTNKGLYSYSFSSNKLDRIHPELLNKKIQCILKQSGTRLWIATEGDGLYMLNLKTSQVKSYKHSALNPTSLGSNYIRSLALDVQNRLWIGTFNELNIYNDKQDNFEAYISNPVQKGSLSQNSVRSIFLDAQGGMWLGTYFGGLNYYHPLKNRFTHIKRIPFQNSLNDNVVSCIVEDKNQNIWIGTNDYGLNFYNTKTKQFTYYTLQEGNNSSIGSNNVKAVYLDEKRNLVYIGTHTAGLSVLHLDSKKVDSYNLRNSNLPDENVYSIIPAQNGELWIGTLKGLAKFNPTTHAIKVVRRTFRKKDISYKSITTMFRDSKKRLWVGGENGLNVYQSDNLIDVSYMIYSNPMMQNAFVNSIMEDKKGRIWVASRDGLYMYNDRTRYIKHYTVKNGLPNNVIYGVLEDSFGRMWVSSNKGLSCLSPESDSFRNYTESDGIQSNQFNNYSFCRTRSGEMYFGGINGITTFRPELLIDNPYTPSVVINDLKLFNKSVRPDDETGVLSQNICMTDAITLAASQSAFSLEFLVSNYISGQHNTFAYMLDGYDKEWYTLTDRHSVSYSNLPAGTYTFKVKAANSDGKWNETPTELKITILPVWYMTWWALSLFTILLAGVSLVTFRFLWIRKNMESQLRMERLEKEKQHEVSQMKMRFFINISHELRTPLTLILAPLQELLNRINDKWSKQQLEYIERNANRLLHLVNQMMDYRRAELGVLELKVKEGNIGETIRPIFMLFDKLAKKKGITYQLESEVESEKVLFDSNYMELITNNLLSNAFKFTPEGGTITLKMEVKENNLYFSVSDTGIGISKDKQARIFERFYQVDGDHFGTGIGLSLVKCLVELHHGTITLESEKGQGSLFTICIPQSVESYHAIELYNAEDSAEVNYHSTNKKESFYLDANSSVDDHKSVEGEEQKNTTILVVEDNQEISDYLNENLSVYFNILQAPNGEVALEVLKEKEVDVIITDVMMPVMDGIKFCKQVKRNIHTCHIPVIILSAKSDVKDQLEGLHVGADDYMPKPFSLDILTTKIQNMLRTRYRAIEKYSKSMDVEPEKVTFNVLDEELLKRAVEVVKKNMDNIEFSADEFAREMNMSRSNLHLKMKAITGESTIDFVRKIRFNEACKLLKEGRYTIAEISSMVGFNTPSYFATSFKKYIGCLPTEYIKNRRG